MGGLIKSEGFLRAQDEGLFDLHIASIGHTTESAREANLKSEAADMVPQSLYPLLTLRDCKKNSSLALKMASLEHS